MKFNLNQFIASCLFITACLATNEIAPAEEPLNIMLSSIVGSRSHVKYLMEISKSLRDRGHTITYAAPEDYHKFNDPYGYNVYNLGMSINGDRKSIQQFNIDEILRKGVDFMPSEFGKFVKLNYEHYFKKYEKLFEKEKVDLIICDFFARPCFDAARKHSIPLMVSLQGLGIGVGEAPYITNSMSSSPTTTENLSFLQRFKISIIDQIVFTYKYMPLSNAASDFRRKQGVPVSNNPWGDFDRVMKINNAYLGMDDSRPIESSLKLIGPVIDTDIQELDGELQGYLDEYKTMYMAFGSHVALNNRLLTALLEAAQMSIDSGAIDGVLWGLASTDSENFPKSYIVNGITYSTSDILSGKHKKIKILKWAPQISILNHHNTKLFLSHGGLESLHESVNSGTPILAMPMLGDQPRNGLIVKNKGIGDYVNALTTNSTDLFAKIKELTSPNNTILQSKVKHLQYINKFNNGKRLENALFIEHYANSAKICRKYQTPKAFEIPCELEPYMQADTKMSYFAAYKIDIILALAGIGSILVALTLVGVFLAVKMILNKNLPPKKLKDE